MTTEKDLAWIHRYEAGSSGLTLLLLHGTGGDENSLFDVGRELAPEANLLSVQGRSLEEGSPRFFRRFSATQYDQPHLREEAEALARFVSDASAAYGFDKKRVVSLGFSNGANIALASLLLSPSTYIGAILLRPVMALEEPPKAELSGVNVLVVSGLRDPYQPYAAPVAPFLKTLHANVQLEVLNTGHELSAQDLSLVSNWLREKEYS